MNLFLQQAGSSGLEAEQSFFGWINPKGTSGFSKVFKFFLSPFNFLFSE
jgi:hypothetical protein